MSRVSAGSSHRERAVVIGCNCGKKTVQSISWIYKAPSGAESVYRSQVEANAARIRNGNQGTVFSR